MSPSESHEMSRLLRRYGDGDTGVEAELLSAVYDELHALAAGHMRDQSPAHTLQPTALINEAWLRLIHQDDLRFDGRSQFFALASRIMRSVLVDHARRAQRSKRADGRRGLSLDPALAGASDEAAPLDLLDLDERLQRLEEVDPALCRVVELRFFGGLSHPEIAKATGSSLRTVERNWRLARAWLQSSLSE